MGEWRRSQWQPIETAPRDGRTIMAANYGDGGYDPYYWEKTPNHWGEIGWQPEDSRQGSFLHRHPCRPDVWIETPEPPKEEA